ncbi:zinc finger protein 862-like isoform X2 [Ptychodera flava]
MLCRACQKFNMKARNGSGVWSAIPCVAIRKDSVQRHSETEAHQQALGLERDGKENTPVNEVFQVQVNMQRLALEGAMKCLYWLGKNEISHTTKFTSLMDFVKGMGCTYLEHLDQGANAHYTSERAIQEMLMSIATVISDDIYKSIRSSPTFSLLMDETTDVAILKQLITYIKYIKTTDNKCEVKTAFVHIDDLADGKACSIVKSTQDMFAQLDLSFTDCTALGSDGAAVMVGRRTGVATQLRELNSSMINIHCVAHRLALAAGQAMAGIPYLKRLSSTLQQLFYFYQNSAVRMAGLQEIQKILGSSEVRLKEAKHVRWLSHQRAVDAVRRSLSSIIVSLERESEERHDATATGLAMFLKQFNFVASILMLSDVLPHLTRLSLMFQKKDVDVTILDTIISSTITAIRTLKTQPGTHTMNVESYLNEDLAEHSVTSTDAVKQRFKDQVYDKYIDAVCDNLEQRFPDVQLIGAFSIFDPSLVEDDASLEMSIP